MIFGNQKFIGLPNQNRIDTLNYNDEYQQNAGIYKFNSFEPGISLHDKVLNQNNYNNNYLNKNDIVEISDDSDEEKEKEKENENKITEDLNKDMDKDRDNNDNNGGGDGNGDVSMNVDVVD
jgi:hypothetical protein